MDGAITVCRTNISQSKIHSHPEAEVYSRYILVCDLFKKNILPKLIIINRLFKNSGVINDTIIFSCVSDALTVFIL